MLRSILVASALVSAFAARADAAGPAKHELKHRALTITDATSSIPELHVLAPFPTTLAFQSAVMKDGVLLVDPGQIFQEPQQVENTVILLPKKALPADYAATVNVSMADGTVVPFKISPATGDADVQVDVTVKIERASPDSPTVLKAQITQLHGQLDECHAGAGSAGISKIAQLILGQDLKQPQAFERHAIHKLDKQSRLLVEAEAVYRLFGLTYLVLTIENRDPDRAWVLDRPGVSLAGGGQSEDVKVLTFATEMASLPSGETEKVVVVFATPAQQTEQRVDLSLLEKDGNRHVRLERIAL